MSVAIMISPIDGGELLDYAPVATQSAFRDLWLPICSELGIELIPLFESGLLITEDMFDDVLRELERLETFVRQKSNIIDYANLIERLNTIKNKLISYKENPNVKVWIG